MNSLQVALETAVVTATEGEESAGEGVTKVPVVRE
jgi:hypothetical protein